MTPGLTLLNLGLGRDSLTMLCLIKEGTLPVPDAVVFADTGAEWPHTYALLPRVAAHRPALLPSLPNKQESLL